jgi:hypothetical protein
VPPFYLAVDMVIVSGIVALAVRLLGLRRS